MALDKGTEAAGKRYEGLAEDYDRKDLRAFGGNKLNRYIATLLGDDEGTRKSLNLSRSIGKNLFDNDRTEDTLRHIFLGGNVKSPIGSFLIDAREWLEGMPRKPEEGQMPRENYVDVTNNKYGRALREMYPNDADFDREALKAALALYRGKEPPEINGIKPLLSTGEEYLNYNEMSEKPVGLQPNRNEMAEGGTVMDKQMRMAFMDNGGLQDDGMDRDPVSGNDVPSGSLAEEVRDDIPAQLSEGEYVVPADVVRFFGVKFFEDLRMQAKMGLAQMERSGRIGGEPIEDDGEMMDSNDEAILIAMTPDMNRGGLIGMATGGISDADREAIGVDETPDPYRDTLVDYDFVGGSLFPSKRLTEETWYHPDGTSKIIKRDANGNVVPVSDTKFTQGDWKLVESKDADDKEDEVVAKEDTEVDHSRTSAAHERAEDRARQVAQWDFINESREKQGLKPLVLPGMNQDWYKNRQQSSVKLATNPDGSINYDKVLTDSYGQIAHLPEANFKAIEAGWNKNKDLLTQFGVDNMNQYHKMSPIDRARLAQYRNKSAELTDEDSTFITGIMKKYLDDKGTEFVKGFNIVNPLASKAAEWVGDKLRGDKDFLRGGEYVSPKQQEYIELLFKKQAQLGEGALNKTEQDQLNAFKKVFGTSGEKFVTDSGGTRFSTGFELPETPVSSSSSNNLEEIARQERIAKEDAERDAKVAEAKKQEEATRLQRQIDASKKRDAKINKRASDRSDRINEQVKKIRERQKKEAIIASKTKKEAPAAPKIDYDAPAGPFAKGGLASKPQPKPKKKRTTKGLGTKPKAT